MESVNHAIIGGSQEMKEFSFFLIYPGLEVKALAQLSFQRVLI